MRSLKFHYFSDKQTLYKVWMASPNIPSVIVIQKKKKSKKRALPVGMIGVIDGGIDY